MAEVTLTPVKGTSFINSASPDSNFTAFGFTLGERSDQTDQKKRPILVYDFSQLTGATINSATLRAYITGDASSNARTARVYRLKRIIVSNQVTWNSYSSGNAWQTAGGTGANDIDTTEVGTRAFSASETLNAYKDFTLNTTKIQEMVDGTFTNNGFLVKMDTESDDGYTGPVWDDATNPHTLVIDYTPGTSIKSVAGVVFASIKKIAGIAIASVKKVAGVE